MKIKKTSILAMILALSATFAFASCGTTDEESSVGTSSISESSSIDVSTPDASTPDVSTPDVSTPDASTSEESSTEDSSTEDSSSEDSTPSDVTAPTFGALDESVFADLERMDSIVIPMATATDDVDASVTITATLSIGGTTNAVAMGSTVTMELVGEYTLTYLAVDTAGNEATKTVKFTVAEKMVAYTVEHYFEGEDGEFAISTADTENLTAMLGSQVTATAKVIDDYVVDTENQNAVASATLTAEGATLKVYYKFVRYMVTFNTAGGAAIASQEVKKGQAAVQPATPERQYCTFVEWQVNGVAYDFATPVVGDVEVVAVWEETSRYAGRFEDGTAANWAMDVYFETSTMETVNVDGNDVIAYTYQCVDDGGILNGDWMKIDCEGAAESIMKEASTKKYIGFKVYSPVQGLEIDTVVVLANTPISGQSTYKYRLQKGWNEIVIDMEARMARHGIDWATMTDHIYRFGVCATKVAFTESAPTETELTLYFDDFYATDYDMANMIDFDSIGDINRYEFNTKGNYDEIDYAHLKHHFPGNMTTGVEVVQVDGRTVLKLSKLGDYISFGLKMGNGAWFNSNVSDYSKLVICFKVDDGVFDIATDLGYVSNTNASAKNEWVTYELDLTNVDQLTTLDFAGWGNTVVYIDYIQFVK